MAGVRKQYAFRVYLNNKPYLEYRYYSLKDIYSKTTLYENGEQLKEQIKQNLGITSGNLSLELVYYKNKTKQELEKVPILYKEDALILNREYLDSKFEYFLEKPYLIEGQNFIISFLNLFTFDGECQKPGLKEKIESIKSEYEQRGYYILKLRDLYKKTSNLKTRLRVYYLIKMYVARQDEIRKENQRRIDEAFQRDEDAINARIKEWHK